MDIEKHKTGGYKKNQRLEELLSMLNDSLEYTSEFSLPIKKKFPTIFIVGTPRSGTTLLTQWLASLKLFCYPSNLISRFYKAPYIGALVQEMLVNPDYSYKNELKIDTDISFRSDTGKTAGITEPHEFWYYWRLFFDFPEIPISNSDFIKNTEFDGFQNGIHKLQQIYGKPFLLKSLIMNWYIESFVDKIYKPIFIYIKRDPIANMNSLLQTRERYLGSRELWFSFKPKEYELFKNEDSFVQVAGQVYFTNKSIEKGLEKVPEHQQLQVDYEEFCHNPLKMYDALLELLDRNGYPIIKPYHGPKQFSVSVNKNKSNNTRLNDAYLFVQKLESKRNFA